MLVVSYRRTYDADIKGHNRAMNEPKELSIARAHFAQAELHHTSPAALGHIEKALAALDDIPHQDEANGALAQRIAIAYATKLCGRLQSLLNNDAHVPEPQLEHFFKMLRAFDDSIIELPAIARQLKIELAKRLIEFYLEGHPTQAKEQALRQLLNISAEP